VEKWLLGLDSSIDLPARIGVAGGLVAFASSPTHVSCVFSSDVSWRSGKSGINISSCKIANDEAWPTGCSFQYCLLPVDREPRWFLEATSVHCSCCGCKP
jgi:hypothetical protein